MLHAQSLLDELNGLALGHPIYLYQEIGSTNDAARRLAQAGAPEGLLVVAEAQTAGRGRAGRSWLTPPGTALAFSLVLRPKVEAAQASRLTMLAGVVVCEAIEQAAPVSAELKWPNDVLVGGRKAGGILVEAEMIGDRLAFAIVGVGLNVNAAPPPEAVHFPATSLRDEAGRPVERLPLLRAILTRLEARYPGLASAGLPAAWRSRLKMLGRPVVVHGPEGELAGMAEDVDADGALVLRLDSGERRRILAGDARLRPA